MHLTGACECSLYEKRANGGERSVKQSVRKVEVMLRYFSAYMASQTAKDGGRVLALINYFQIAVAKQRKYTSVLLSIS